MMDETPTHLEAVFQAEAAAGRLRVIVAALGLPLGYAAEDAGEIVSPTPYTRRVVSDKTVSVYLTDAHRAATDVVEAAQALSRLLSDAAIAVDRAYRAGQEG